MFIRAFDEIINANRVTRIWVDAVTNHNTARIRYSVKLEMSDGQDFNEYTGVSTPAFRSRYITDQKEGSGWGSVCYDLVKSMFSAMGNNRNFDVEEWLISRGMPIEDEPERE